MQLYTSGSTGKPKGVQHTTGGYMVGAALTTKYVFDAQPDDVYWCTADCGWITGHSYVTYGIFHLSSTAAAYTPFQSYGLDASVRLMHKPSLVSAVCSQHSCGIFLL